VILDGDAQKAARGAYAPTFVANAGRLDALQRAGAVADGTTTPDGTTRTGATATDYLVGTASTGADGGTFVEATVSTPTADVYVNQYITSLSYASNSVGGDTLSLLGQVNVYANGNTVAGPQHICGVFGSGYLFSPGNLTWVNGGVFQSGNQGSGTVTNAVDVRGHADNNNGGGALTNHFFLYQEQSTAAVHEYGAYFSAPVGIGTDAPTALLHIQPQPTQPPLNNIYWAVIGSGNGMAQITSVGMSLYPGYSGGGAIPGAFGATDIFQSTGSAGATNDTTGFLYISSCAGAPTSTPAQSAAGRVAMRYDTTNNKLWIHNGTSWRGVLLT
jgi:hypothetical protein